MCLHMCTGNLWEGRQTVKRLRGGPGGAGRIKRTSCRAILYSGRKTGSGRRMSRTTLWLLASLGFASLTSLADGAPLQVMSAPNLLRVGTAENIFVECQDCTGGDMKVDVIVMNHPTKNKRLATTSVTLNAANNFQQFGQITVPAADFSKDPNMKQFVYLQAQFPDRLLEKVVLVSFQSGYIFIQTDKTIYTPNSKVHYRMFAVTPRMEPVERDEQTQTDASIAIEIVTPENIILPLDPVSLKSGIHSGDHQLGEIVSPGLWKVVAKFHSNPQQSYSAEFEVKEYVLRSFNLFNLMFLTFNLDYFFMSTSCGCRYLFGEEVDGTAYVVFGVINEGQKKSFPGSLQRVGIENGNGQVTLKRDHIIQTFPKILDLVGKPIYVAVSVLTESGGEMVEAELRGIQIVTSPYTISFKRTPKYFKPGMSFDVAVEVLNPDETPAQGVPVVVEPGAVQGITAANGMARLTVNTVAKDPTLSITAKTGDPRILAERQAKATMVAYPYTTNSNSYIHIGVDTAELELGNNFKINLNLNKANQDNDITYLILSRGQLVKHGRYRSRGQVLISLNVPIAKEMLPSFRIIAYYHPSNNEVVSDSIWVDVKDSCMGSLKLESTRPAPSYEPRRMFGLKVTGDPEATVGLVAVDKGVYVLNNKHRLTQKKVWDIVEKYDTGCTPGGGKNSMSVFYDAGLLFESSTASGTPYRQELKCPAPSRRKRASTIMDVTTTLVSKYENELQRDCCLDGMRDTPLSYTCERRSEYILDGAACVEAFLHCCKEMATQRAEKKEENLQLARSEEDDDSYMDSNEIVSRTNFPESWLWSDIKLPACPRQTPNCKSTFFTKNVPLQDSITTWEFTGISLSRTEGICVGEPLEVIVRKEFFIDLRLPYSAVRGEQLEVKAILHNYSPDPATVRVDLIEEDNLCSAASKHGKYRQEVKVGPQTTRSVPFIIIPMKEGEFRIEVKAAVKDSSLNDGIRKVLRVVPEGVLVKSPQVVILDPSKNGAGHKQEEILNSGIPKKDLVPNTPTSTQISVTGRENISPLVENAISGASMGSLIYQPSGCGEQNMIHMTLPVIATTYLDKTNQWETVGLQKRNEALQHISTGYKNELAYRKPEGSFAVWANRQGSTWLTAYVAKVFAMANSLVAVQNEVICGAVKFLILNAQQPDGMFKEVGTVSHGEMIGDVRGTDSDASMTAFCLIAMQESRTLCAATVNSLPGSIEKAVTYLEKRLPSLTNPYAVAMTSYALANENKMNRDILYKFVSPELSHWPVLKGRIYTLEATAYALLALVKTRDFEGARPVVRWFSQQQKVGGGYGSTQATIIVYQAVAEYWASAKEPEYDLNVDILLPGRSKPDKFNFNRENHFGTRTSKINDINQDVKVTATGTGEATLTMVSLYYAIPKEKESDCQKFNMSVTLHEEKMDEEEKIYRLTIKVLYKDRERDATMSVLDIGLLTGFTPNTNDLDLVSFYTYSHTNVYEHSPVRKRLTHHLPGQGQTSVSHRRSEEISFRIHQKLKVGVLQPAAVSVYEYYDQTHCVKFYHPERKGGQLLRLCRNDECTCAEENCSMQKKGKISNDLRTAKSCESTPTSKIDFVYKVRLEGFTDSLSTDIYTMRVQQVIKEGSSDVGPEGNVRAFLSYPHCREALDLGKGKSYLIMGTSKDIHRDEQHNSYQYVLGERTWIEYWPTDAECQLDQHRPTCLGLEEMVQQYALFGCQQK
uniref:Complement component c3a, duplicate 5 n=1 Tax=Anabas testudineus TaxID=64144 RepID=A0A3Q1IJ17_ANATE